jgi:hypothetical protein
VAVVTLLVLIQGGVESNLFVFYFPALLVFAVAFSAGATAAFAGGTLGAYAVIALATSASETDVQTVGVRLLMLAGVAVCGAVYRQIEAERREERSRRPSVLREAAEDVFFGQVVMIWARWFVIAAAGMVTLWSARSAAEMTVNMLLVVLLMALNFFLHARYLLEKPANPTLIRLLGVLDLLVVGAIVLSWHAARGFESSFFVLYYPLLVAFAFVFPARQVAVFAGTAVATYTGVCLVADQSLVTRIADVKVLTIRLVTIASVAGLATYYWRFQRDARRSTASGSSGDTDGWERAELANGADAPAVGGASAVPSPAGAA